MSVKNICFFDNKVSCKINNYIGYKENDTAIIFCVDKGYLAYALFAIEQIIHLEKDRKFDICICLPDIKLIPEYFLQLPVRYIEIEVSGVDNLPVDHLSLAAYNRIFLPHIFSKDYKEIIYLDADIYICKPFFDDLNEIINTFPKDFCVAGAPDITEINKRSRLKNGITEVVKDYLEVYHKSNHIYRNSGVLIFNVDKCNEQNIAERVLLKAFDTNSDLRCHDQSAINLAFKGEMPIIPFEFNWQLIESNYRLIDSRHPYLIHFISRNKPWMSNFVYTRPYINEYKSFLQKHFPEKVVKLKSPEQIRIEKPKYQDPKREKFSRLISKIKAPLSNVTRDIKFSLYRNQKVSEAIDIVNNVKS